MHRGWIDILGKVVVAMTGCLGTNASPALLVELVEVGALDIAHVRNRNDHRIIGIEVLGIELVIEGNDLRATLVAILLLHFEQIVLHHFLATLRIVENLLQVGNELLQIVELLMKLLDTQTCQLRESHIDDGL